MFLPWTLSRAGVTNSGRLREMPSSACRFSWTLRRAIVKMKWWQLVLVSSDAALPGPLGSG